MCKEEFFAQFVLLLFHAPLCTMEIQQAIIVVMLTAVICIFVGIITTTQFPDDKMMRIVTFGFVVIPWILIVTVSDLYIELTRLRTDMNTHMKCT